MTHGMLVAAHVVAAVMLGIAIAGLWLVDGKARRTTDLSTFQRMLRRMAAIEQRLLMPSVITLLASGVWLVAGTWGFWSVVYVPWLAGMVALYVFQAVWANAVTRPQAARLERLAAEAQLAGAITPALHVARLGFVASFGRHVEPLAYLLIMALGAFRPMSWTGVLAGVAAAGVAAGVSAALSSAPALRYSPASRFSSASVDAEGRT